MIIEQLSEGNICVTDANFSTAQNALTYSGGMFLNEIPLTTVSAQSV